MNIMSKIFFADFSEFKEMISYIKEGLMTLNFNDETVNTAHIICDEFITNIIKNAYESDLSDTYSINGANFQKPLKISYSKTEDLKNLSIQLTDWGRPFNPLEYPDDLKDEQTHGGFGIHIAKNLADSIKYQREKGKNILTLFITQK